MLKNFFIDVIVVVLYFGAMIGIGIYSRKRSKNQEEYFMGGRRFGKIIQTFAVFGAGTSADSPIGTVRNTFTGGLSGIWTVLNWLWCTPFYWFLGKWYRRMRIITLGDFYDERYDSRGLAGVYAIFALVFFMGYISIGLSAVSKTILAVLPKSEYALTIEERQELAEFNRIKELETKDFALLSLVEKEELDELRIKNPRGLFPIIDSNLLIYILGSVTVIYSVMGGLTAAYLTDLIQGNMIILLSLLLIPFALAQITQTFGGESLLDGFKIMHAKIPEEFFEIFGSPHAGDFTWYYVLSVVLMNLVGIISQPHQMSTGGGTAKDELSGRIGLVVGSYLKRFCTLFWALTALLILTLYPGQVSDPDLMWGFATRMLLGPLGIGLVGLMLASLFAALMSSVSAYMVSSAALVVRNLYTPFAQFKSERFYVNIGRMSGVIIVVGAIYLSIYFQDVFMQFKFIWELPIIFGASLWIGLLWRRATAAAVWTNVAFSSLFFFMLPATLPSILPGLSTNENHLLMTNPPEITRVYEAKEFDVVENDREIQRWERLSDNQKLNTPQPRKIAAGDEIQKTIKPKGVSIFWTKGIIVRDDGIREGQGLFNIEMILYQKLGLPLDRLPNSLIETLRLPFRIIIPIVLILLISLFTHPADKERLDRFYAKMKVPVNPIPENDMANIEKALLDTESLERCKMFPHTNFEFEKLSKEDIIGFAANWGMVFLIIWLAVAIAYIGR